MTEEEIYIPKSTEHYTPASEIEMIPKPDDFVPEQTFPAGHAYEGHQRCTAWSPRQGRQCKRLASKGMKVCQKHGGKNMGGALSPTFKHGKRSKYLPAEILQKYEEVSNDPEYLSLRFEIDMIDVRVLELLESLEEMGDSTAWVRDLQKAYDKFEDALKSKNKVNQKIYFDELGEIIEKGAKRRDIWNELARMFEAKKRLSKAERDRLESMQAMWTAEEAVTFASALSASFKSVLERYIPDGQTTINSGEELRTTILREQAIEARMLLTRSQPKK